MLKPKQEFFAKSVSQIINEQRGSARMAMTRRVHPLLSLNAYQGSWTIKVRVTNKGVLRTYKNARGDGCVFNVELTDEEGTEIQEPMFNAAARKSYDTFHKGKLANKQFKTVQNDYEMTLNEYEAGSEEMFITETKFNFVPIDELLVRAVSYVELLLSLNTVFRMIISHLNATDLGQQLLDMADKYPVIANKSLKGLHFVKSVADRNQFLQVFHYPLSKAAKLKSWYDSEGGRKVGVCEPVFFSTRAYISFIKPPDQEGEANEFQTKLKEATWSSHLFRVSVSQQEYNSEKRQRITVRRVSPIDFAAKTRLLLQDVSKNKKTSQ
uniref:Replication factor A C-terminal domain-containing protein n=1 Tax=Brassica oleracea var. oleracea TaxID=109376 RepID=A0A0D3AAR7_BRAOL